MSAAPRLDASAPRPPRVRLLDPHTVNQIAAGEVVERPASVVKELVENALDAGARRIEVELEDYGRRRIVVSDDGCGMSEADARAALLRHATSKIARASDLQRVDTLGFRGEALPSIASVARLTIATGEDGAARFAIVVEDGETKRSEWRAGPRGTRVEVEDLFRSTPARLKFLRSDATELGACVECVSRYAIAYPEVAMVLRHGSTILLEAPGTGDPLAAIAAVWGREVARGLAEIDGSVAGIRVRGFVSPPHLTRSTRALQWLWVNRRPVRSRTLTAAIDAAYRALTPERRHAIVALGLKIDPARIDANVSPTKSEVKFQQEGAAFDAVRLAIREGLVAFGMVPSAGDIAHANAALAGAGSGPAPAPGEDGRPRSFVAAARPQSPLFEGRPGDEDSSSPPAGFAREDFADGLRVIGQLDETFILAENARGLLIVDQHVAHERVLFERLRDRHGETSVERQALLAPEAFGLDRRSSEALRSRIDEVRRLSFDVEPFGGDTFLVRAIPAVLRPEAALAALRDLASEMAEGGVGPGDVREALWTLCACKMAVKANDRLGLAEMERLIWDLAETENPYLCPHGRPITIILERRDLDRKFKR